MLDYILINKKKTWGLVIIFLVIFGILSLVNRTSYDSGLQKVWVNIVVSVSFSLFGYISLLLGAFIDYQRATTLFDSPPFKVLLEKGFKTESTAVNSRFLFAGKRITGSVDGFPVKIGGSRKRFQIFIGINEHITDRIPKKQIVNLLKPKGLTFEEIFVEKLIILKSSDTADSFVWDIIVDLIAFLKTNGFEPRESK